MDSDRRDQLIAATAAAAAVILPTPANREKTREEELSDQRNARLTPGSLRQNQEGQYFVAQYRPAMPDDDGVFANSQHGREHEPDRRYWVAAYADDGKTIARVGKFDYIPTMNDLEAFAERAAEGGK